MKKFFGILAIATVFVACGNNGTDTTTNDSTSTTTETTAPAMTTPSTDSMGVPVTGDSSMHATDSMQH